VTRQPAVVLEEEQWKRLDDFEGAGYTQVLTTTMLRDGQILPAYIYGPRDIWSRRTSPVRSLTDGWLMAASFVRRIGPWLCQPNLAPPGRGELAPLNLKAPVIALPAA